MASSPFRGFILVTVVAFCFMIINTSAVDIPHPTDPTYDKDCIVNTTLPDTADDNYYDCQTDEIKEAGTTDCCKLDGKVGCCVPEGGLGRMAQIGIGMACGTLFLMTLTFIWNWCDVQTFPCLKTCKVKCRRCCCKKCLSCPCCAEDGDDNFDLVKVKMDQQGNLQEEEPVPEYETPDELKANVKDEFFG